MTSFRLAREYYPISISAFRCTMQRKQSIELLCFRHAVPRSRTSPYVEQELKPESALSRMAESLDTRIIHDLASIKLDQANISHLLRAWTPKQLYNTYSSIKKVILDSCLSMHRQRAFLLRNTIQCDIAYHLSTYLEFVSFNWFESANVTFSLH